MTYLSDPKVEDSPAFWPITNVFYNSLPAYNVNVYCFVL